MFPKIKLSVFVFIITWLSLLLCENVAAGRDSILDPNLEVSKQIMRLAKSAEIQAMLDPEAQPCDDFYKYACGRWHRHNPAQLMTNIITDRFQMLAHAFERRLYNFLDFSQNRTDGALAHKVRDFYISCQLIEADHISYVLHLENIYKEYGNLPVLANGNWKEESDFNWWSTVANIQQKYGKHIIFAVDIMSNIKNHTNRSIYLGSPLHAVGISSKFEQKLQELRIVDDLAHIFGVEHSIAEKTAREMIEFEEALMHSGTNMELGMEIEDLLVLKKLTDFDEISLHGFEVRKFVEIVLNNTELVPDEIYIYDMKYFNNTLKIISETPKSTVANYILWQLLQEYLIDNSVDNEEKRCQKISRKYFDKYLDYALYQSYKTEEMEQDVYNVWEEVRETFRDALKGDKLDWITNATRTYAIEKLNSMNLQINSHEDLNFTHIYSSLNINRLGYVENVRQLLMLETQNKFKKFTDLFTKIIQLDYSNKPYSTSYNLFENSINIPVALLQPHFFWDKNYPQAIKYATLGYLISHEIIHGFDDVGRHHDKDGNEFSWWDAKSTYEFESRRKCFRAQYQNFKFEGYHLPSGISQTENIADNAAVRLAYRTYVRWLNKQLVEQSNIEETERLPGQTFDNRQLFFVSFAQLWCTDVQVLFKYPLAAADTHAPNMYRVIGALQNFQEFSWIFKCNPEARMDPKYKCYLY